MPHIEEIILAPPADVLQFGLERVRPDLRLQHHLRHSLARKHRGEQHRLNFVGLEPQIELMLRPTSGTPFLRIMRRYQNAGISFCYYHDYLRWKKAPFSGGLVSVPGADGLCCLHSEHRRRCRHARRATDDLHHYPRSTAASRSTRAPSSSPASAISTIAAPRSAGITRRATARAICHDNIPFIVGTLGPG